MKRLAIVAGVILVVVIAGAVVADTLRINLDAVKNPQKLVLILSRLDYQLDDIRAYLTTDDYVFSDPNLTYGSSNAAKIKISNTWYVINGVLYYVASAETPPAAGNVPQNKYGAWALEIGADGTTDSVAAGANTTGYASAAAAVAGLPAVQTDHARLGYVTEIYTDGTFVPGTTTFTTSGVTATFTDLLPTAKLVSDTVQGGK